MMPKLTCKWTQGFLKVFFKKLAHIFFLSFFKYHVVFQDQPKDYIGENGIIDTIDVTVL